MDERRYALYSSQDKDFRYPNDFAEICVRDSRVWIIVDGVLSVNELKRCGLRYHGHQMNYKTCQEEIRRLEGMG